MVDAMTDAVRERAGLRSTERERPSSLMRCCVHTHVDGPQHAFHVASEAARLPPHSRAWDEQLA